MERLRAAARAIGRSLASGPGGGALALFALFALDFLGSDVGFMGLRDPRAVAKVMERARAHAIEEELLILVVLAGIGALMGAVGALCGRGWDAALGRPAPRRPALRGVAAALLGHAFFFLRSVIHYPQLYSTRLYDPGGVRRAAMVLLTDRLPAPALDLSFALMLGVLLAGPLVTARGRAAARAGIERAVRTVRRRQRVAAMMAAALVVIVGFLVVGRRRPAPTRAPGRPNVLVIAVDSLRADRVFTPDAAERFPAMASLAARGVRFREAYVSQARTFPSFVSLLTGRYPQHHGIRHEFPSTEARAAVGPSLVSTLRDAGWRTAAVSDFSGEIFARTPLGFADVDAPRVDLFSIVDEQILDAHVDALPYAATALGESIFPAMRSMAELDDPSLLDDHALAELDRVAGQPFFLVVFYSSTHSPYPAPDPYYRRFTDPGYEGPFRYLKEPLPPLAALPPAEAQQVQALYDDAAAAVDASIARLLRRLDEDGVAKDTIVVLLGDHGENLFDVPGRGMGHGDHLWGSLANHIPLVIVDPTHPTAPHDVEGIVRDVDLAPTLGGLLGVRAPAVDGVDLAPLLRGEQGSLDLDAYAETGLWLLTSGPGYRVVDRLPYPDLWNITEATPDGDIFLQPQWEGAVVAAKDRSIRTPSWKLVYQPAPDGSHWRLFDVRVDPHERADVALEHPAEVAALRAKLETWITSDGHTAIQADAKPAAAGR